MKASPVVVLCCSECVRDPLDRVHHRTCEVVRRVGLELRARAVVRRIVGPAADEEQAHHCSKRVIHCKRVVGEYNT